MVFDFYRAHCVYIQNAWLLDRNGGSSITQLEFRRAIAIYYCQTYGTEKPPQSYRRLHTNEHSSRYDELNHFVIETPEKKRRRCAGKRKYSSFKNHVPEM